jgi:hypothetical protein
MLPGGRVGDKGPSPAILRLGRRCFSAADGRAGAWPRSSRCCVFGMARLRGTLVRACGCGADKPPAAHRPQPCRCATPGTPYLHYAAATTISVRRARLPCAVFTRCSAALTTRPRALEQVQVRTYCTCTYTHIRTCKYSMYKYTYCDRTAQCHTMYVLYVHTCTAHTCSTACLLAWTLG